MLTQRVQRVHRAGSEITEQRGQAWNYTALHFRANIQTSLLTFYFLCATHFYAHFNKWKRF